MIVFDTSLYVFSGLTPPFSPPLLLPWEIIRNIIIFLALHSYWGFIAFISIFFIFVPGGKLCVKRSFLFQIMRIPPFLFIIIIFFLLIFVIASSSSSTSINCNKCFTWWTLSVLKCLFRSFLQPPEDSYVFQHCIFETRYEVAVKVADIGIKELMVYFTRVLQKYVIVQRGLPGLSNRDEHRVLT